MPFENFWQLPKTRQAELIWDALFIKNSPVSESCRGILTTLNLLGLDVRQRDLKSVRAWFAEREPEEQLARRGLRLTRPCRPSDATARTAELARDSRRAHRLIARSAAV